MTKGNENFLKVKDLKKWFPATSGGVLRKRIGWVKAVDGVDFSLLPQETLGIVGESGCGKTTLGKLLLGIEDTTDGEIIFKGKNIKSLKGSDYKQYRKKVQTVFQNPWESLNPRMRVGEIIGEPLLINFEISRREIKEKVQAILEEVGLSKKSINNYPHEFSGGERQRIAIASAIIMDPDLVVLDEPVSALDISIQAQIMNLLKYIQQCHKISYIFISHNLATARYMTDKIGVMYLGEFVEYSVTEEIFIEPLHPYTKALFSAALPYEPSDKQEEIYLSGELPSPLNPPPGCKFHPRCKEKIGKICEEKKPKLKEVKEKNHFVACHLV